MAVNSSKLSIQDIYSIIADKLGLTLADGVEAPMMPRLQFLRSLNLCLSEISSATDNVERLVLLTPDRRWLRYIKVTLEEANTGQVKINLMGQKPSLQSATDPDNLDWQYEDPCTGNGVDPDYAQTGTAIAAPPFGTAPDSFPKIYLPAECNIPLGVYTPGIPLASYGYMVDVILPASSTYNEPMGQQNRIGGSNEPLTPFVIDMRKVGYGSFTVGNADYPTTATPDRFFIDPYMIYALRCITYTNATDYNIPLSADAYLNDTWANILAMIPGVDTAVVRNPAPGVTSFVLDGVIYDVTIIAPGTFNVVGNLPFTFRVTEAGTANAWDYQIFPNNTPWTTVGLSARWASLTASSALWANRAWYVKLNDFVLRLPDDYRKCKWLWKIPISSMGWDLPEDPTADIVSQYLADTESVMYSRLDEAYHYFPVTETKFTQLKYLETTGHNFQGEGFYIQTGQQLRLVPRPVDLKSAVIAMIYEAKPDNVDLTLQMGSFATTFLELPSESVNVIIYMYLAGLYASSRASDMEKAMWFKREALEALAKLRSLYSGRQGQQYDAPIMTQTLDPGRDTRSFGFNRTRGRYR